MVRASGWRWVWGMILFCAVMATTSYAQVALTTLVNFNKTNGTVPYTLLAQGGDGNLYGTTEYGGANCTDGLGCGTLFKMTPAGTLTTLYDFCSQTNCVDGANPVGALVQAADTNLYGTTTAGGKNNGGTIFKISPKGNLTILYSFCALTNCVDGAEPSGGLVQAKNGKFYGTTFFGGAGETCISGCGTIFEVTPAGKLTTVYSFCAQSHTTCPDGNQPSGRLVQGRNGYFFGETLEGGANLYGTIFEIKPGGRPTTLTSFEGVNGRFPNGGLIQAVNGDFYGVTENGGNSGSVECPEGCGTVFKITPGGKLTTLYNFCSPTSNCTDGAQPFGPLLQANDGNFYGTTAGDDQGILQSFGTVFEITPRGTLTTLYSFCALPSCSDGGFPEGGLLQSTSGTFYGATFGGGATNDGTIFSLSSGLGPFVKTQPALAMEGARVGIFGQGFTTSSVVQFGGVQATNVKLSGSTFLFAKVPAGALTGSVTVTTGATTLTSNQIFRVKPQVVSFDPPSGSVGTQVTIRGTGFTQTNGVGFGDNVPAEFTVNSDTQITATVPAGAKTGPVGVVTKGGTGISAATFTVN